MNIIDYVQERVARATKRITELDAKRSEVTERQRILENERAEVDRASKSAVAAGLKVDVHATEARLNEVSAKIDAAQLELEGLNKEKMDAVAERDALKPLEDLSQLCRDKLGKVEIPELDTLVEMHSLLQARLLFKDDVATGCQLWLGDPDRPKWQQTLPVKSTITRIRRSVVPPALSWVPADWLPVKPTAADKRSNHAQSLLPAPEATPAQLYYVTDEDEFRSLLPVLVWEEDEERQVGSDHWNRRTQTVRVAKQSAWGVSEDCLTAYLTETFAEKVVDLDTGTDSEVLPGLTEAILASTQAANEVVYAASPKVQTMVEIEKSIGKQFRALVDAPWTPATQGLLAKFKYYCEQGERPRFYNLNVAGAYGFRLRTRDHSWIKGYVYVVPENLTYELEQTKVPEIKSDYRSHRYLRLGRLILRVEDESND